jgi:hypothetical protein
MKFDSVIHVRAEPDNAGGGRTLAEAQAEIDRKQDDPRPLTKCGRYDVPREESVNPPPSDSYADLESQAQRKGATLCPRCLYVDRHPLLRGAVAALAAAQAEEGLRHIFLPGAAKGLCGAVSLARASGRDDGDPFHICLACAAEHERLETAATR